MTAASAGKPSASNNGAATAAGVPPYVVASDRTLRDLATLRPLDHSELLLVHGIGPAKAEKYGADWLAVLAETAALPGD